ncbi:IS66 family transposase, partial [bacterium]|nr:IS66 family transposase [bacterium]
MGATQSIRVAGSVLTPSLGALLLTEKFCYHQPFYRQEWRLKATHGIILTRNLMCSWHDHLAGLLRRLYEKQAERFRLSDYLKVDETPIDYLEPGSGKAQQGYLWAYHHPEHGVLYDWHTSRANTCLDSILISQGQESSFNGYL